MFKEQLFTRLIDFQSLTLKMEVRGDFVARSQREQANDLGSLSVQLDRDDLLEWWPLLDSLLRELLGSLNGRVEECWAILMIWSTLAAHLEILLSRSFFLL